MAYGGGEKDKIIIISSGNIYLHYSTPPSATVRLHFFIRRPTSPLLRLLDPAADVVNNLRRAGARA